MSKEFTKQDLKSGMWAVLRNGGHYFVFLDFQKNSSMILTKPNKYFTLSSYNDDLTRCLRSTYYLDIVEVRASRDFVSILDFDKCEVIWKREEPKTLTQKEHDFLEALAYEHWIARDSVGTICMFFEKPYKDGREWVNDNYVLSRLQRKYFTFITWEDEKPYSTTEMLKWEIKG